jgi:hypothetical protein
VRAVNTQFMCDRRLRDINARLKPGPPIRPCRWVMSPDRGPADGHRRAWSSAAAEEAWGPRWLSGQQLRTASIL